MPKRLWVPLFRLANALVRGVVRLGVGAAPLEPEGIPAEARRAAGPEVPSPGALPEPSLAEGLHRFLSAAETEAELTPIGRLATRRDATRLLAHRLRLAADRSRYPGIAEEPIEAPVFIVGLPRTGTTLLHGLLAADPGNRAPATWEVMEPSPPPGLGGTKARRRRVRRQLRWFDRLAPGYKVAHPLEADLPQECMEIAAHVFQSDRFFRTHHVPDYRDWLAARPADEAYTFHRRFLQHLQWGGPPRQWVLKNPPHIFALDALTRIYPDARFVQIHRDPVTVMASYMSHTRRLRAAFSERPELLAPGPVVERWAAGIDNLLDFRERDAVPAPRWVDLAYAELEADPLAAVQRVYSGLGWSMAPAALEAMEAFLAEHTQHKYGVHRYSPAKYGVDPDAVRDRFARYRPTFAPFLTRRGGGA